MEGKRGGNVIGLGFKGAVIAVRLTVTGGMKFDKRENLKKIPRKPLSAQHGYNSTGTDIGHGTTVVVTNPLRLATESV